jgi:SAM-dependent methyltransferase
MLSRSIDIQQNASPGLRTPGIDWGWEKLDYVPEWHDPLLNLMVQYVPRGARILEVGAGGSHTLGGLALGLGCEAWGVDPDEPGLRSTRSMALRNGTAVRMVQGDGFKLPFPDEVFDTVYSLGLIEHFESIESESLIAEHVRVCRPGGRVLVSVPNLLNLPHTVNKLVLGKRYPFHPERSYLPSRLQSLLERNGLRIVAVDGLLPLWGLGMISWGWRLTALLDRLGLSARLKELKSQRMRAALGYMTFAIGERPGS